MIGPVGGNYIIWQRCKLAILICTLVQKRTKFFHGIAPRIFYIQKNIAQVLILVNLPSNFYQLDHNTLEVRSCYLMDENMGKFSFYLHEELKVSPSTLIIISSPNPNPNTISNPNPPLNEQHLSCLPRLPFSASLVTTAIHGCKRIGYWIRIEYEYF